MRLAAAKTTASITAEKALSLAARRPLRSEVIHPRFAPAMPLRIQNAVWNTKNRNTEPIPGSTPKNGTARSRNVVPK